MLWHVRSCLSIQQAAKYTQLARKQLQDGDCSVSMLPIPPQGANPPRGALHYETVPDLALCRVSIEKLDRAGLKELPFLPLADSSKVREGDEVGTCGFPLGLKITDDSFLRQFTPIIRKGVIAAVLPWTGMPNPHAFQLDIHINGRSSGSPLFLAESGDIVGIVFAAPMHIGVVTRGNDDGAEEIGTVTLPTGFGFAIPSNRYNESPKPTKRLPDLIHNE
jgi:S1-C subfamily serine protease